jgi:CHAD domain-containing protein
MARATSIARALCESDRALYAHMELALDERWRRYRKAFDRCRKKFSEDSVHQLRVETRRLIALLDLLHPLIKQKDLEAVRRGLKKFFRRFARLRDTQVQLAFVEQRRRRFPEVRQFAKALARLEKRLVRKLDRMVRHTGRKRISKLMRALHDGLDKALNQLARPTQGQNVVSKQARKAFDRVVMLRQRIDPTRPLTIHRARVAFKHFRYLVELLQPLLPGVSLRCLQEMHDYQTLMGEIQDLKVLQDSLHCFVKLDVEAAQELERFRQELEHEHSARITHYLEHADQLRQFWPVELGPWIILNSVRRD